VKFVAVPGPCGIDFRPNCRFFVDFVADAGACDEALSSTKNWSYGRKSAAAAWVCSSVCTNFFNWGPQGSLESAIGAQNVPLKSLDPLVKLPVSKNPYV
jgi:hypothetical protein